MTEAKRAGAAPGRCPICSRPSQDDYRPFCSRRCADVDLSRWLRGSYAVAGEPAHGERDEAPATGTSRPEES
ncbi:MAG TPA: DNA gyrase inhibitor YacG [Hyphomicrobiaceae bacterium]|jgi:uncharacterized protein|nr:DNA gyrase inhibitor YacG [Hyphomicrobiaceae bacterium]